MDNNKMNQYCVDLEIAKELKENGLPQETEFYWNLYKAPGNAFPLDDNLNKILESYKAKIGMNEACYATYSAFISDEMLKELPKFIYYDNNATLNTNMQNRTLPRIFWSYTDKKWGIEYTDIETFLDYKLPNALAKMWLYLKKEGHIK